MFAGTEQRGWNGEILGTLQSLDRRAGGDASVQWDFDCVVGRRRGRGLPAPLLPSPPDDLRAS